MSFIEIVDLSSDDDELGEVDVKPVKLEPGFVGDFLKHKRYCNGQLGQGRKSNAQQRRHESEENRSSKALSTSQSTISMLEQGQSPVDDTSLSSSATICPAPLCRQFWKSGSYEDGLGSKATNQNGKNFLHVHPMFLHSNATSHKWAFGAIAELLDNAVDEIQNGATFVIVDKTLNPRDGNPALLIQDDGGGMDAEAMRRCMSFGFSDKKSKSSIGKYGNGFKTSTMRLGADVIVFSRCLNDRILSQSIGLLSYTFLSRTGHDRIVVPMVDYKFNMTTGTLEHLNSKEHFMSNLSMLLQWSPFSTEEELLKQFKDVGPHGTKVIIYNLWQTNEGEVELDFDTDSEVVKFSALFDVLIFPEISLVFSVNDLAILSRGLQGIRIGGGSKKVLNVLHEQHIANRYQFSLREYLSILYLRMPQNFSIILRGRVVDHRIIANDLKYPEFILYKPQSGGTKEGEVITTIGFLKEAPDVNFHGFNVYHKNRLVLPFWQVVSYSCSRGRGVVGVLEANFIEPSHNKQDFERTSLFQKLETRLKEMTWEYWDYHCELIGYQVTKKLKSRTPPQISPLGGKEQPVSFQSNSGRSFHHAETVELSMPNSYGISKQGVWCVKRKEPGDSAEVQMLKRQAGQGATPISAARMQPASTASNHSIDQEAATLLQQNKKLHEKCSEYEKTEKELNLKAMRLKSEIAEYQKEFTRILAEMRVLGKVKGEEKVRV